MTPLENMWIELYMASLIAILYLLGCRGKKEKFTASWYYKYSLIVEFSVLTTDIFLWFCEYRGKGIFLLYEIDWTVNFILYILLVLLYSLYLYAYINENYEIKIEYPIHYFCAVAGISLILWISSYWNDWFFTLNKAFYPEYNHIYFFIAILIFCLLLPDATIFFKIRKKMEKKMVIYFSLYAIIPIVAFTLEYVTQINCLFYSFTSLSLLFVYVVINQKNRMIAYNQSIELQKKETELKETEQKVMMGNIQPLFIQSVLASIADMAQKDPKRAEATTSSFATYLRMNLNSVGKNEPVPFEEEVRHADSYLELEANIRPDKVAVEHDIESYNFFLPVLTLQPIVENAIVHGLLPKGGGTIRLWSREEGDSFLIGVDDDGIGFDSTLVPDGVGISNTRSRLEKFCGGTVNIESEKGKGTKVTLTIPKTTNMTF